MWATVRAGGLAGAAKEMHVMYVTSLETDADAEVGERGGWGLYQMSCRDISVLSCHVICVRYLDHPGIGVGRQG